MSKWFFAADRGGTFTDVIGISPLGKIVTTKVLSESSSFNDSVVQGIRNILKIPPNQRIPNEIIERVRIGTTIATNALLERKGVDTSLVITEGFRDLLEIGNQARPSLFDLSIVKPEQLYHSVKEVSERLNSDGEIVRELDEDRLKNDLTALRTSGIDSIAIALMHSWKNSIHERRCYSIAKRIGFTNISISSEVIPTIKILNRAQTTVVDSYLSPILFNYVSSLREELGDTVIEFMQSSGGLTDATLLTGKDSILSGPAGGVIGCAAISKVNNFGPIIGFDMGGTSTDVSRYNGVLSKVAEVSSGGIEFNASSLDIETVAAGGGSILSFDGQRLLVGPASAGAYPGPICYGLDGKLALTDANLVLGRINPDLFPKVFGIEQNQKLDESATRDAFQKLKEDINSATGSYFTLDTLAQGFIDIANEKMAATIKKISIDRGFDIRNHTLVAFGGAAPQHCCSIARILGIRKVVIHPFSSILSAYGIANANQFRYGVRTIAEPLTQASYNYSVSIVDSLFSPLVSELENLGENSDNISKKSFLDLKVAGTDNLFTIPFDNFDRMFQNFKEIHEKQFGFLPSKELEIVNVRVEVATRSDRIVDNVLASNVSEPKPFQETEIFISGSRIKAPVFLRESLPQGCVKNGPLMVIDEKTTLVVEPDFTLKVNKFGHFIMEQNSLQQVSFSSERDPVSLEIFNNLFMGIAEQMGASLQKTSHSVNIRERLDFSCALFDSLGDLVANAPHVPVHLGAMSESVKSVISSNRDEMKEGDFFLINNPHKGGSHLPDLTVLAPVFSGSDEPTFFVASRGHHADIGGITPGSIPPFSKHISEEGIVIDNFLIVEDGKFRESEFIELLTDSDYPARNLDERINDIKAQIAAVNKGISELNNLVKKYGDTVVTSYMKYIRQNSAEAMSDALEFYVKRYGKKEVRFEDYLDDGSRISVRIAIFENPKVFPSHNAIVDFEGTDPQLDGNLNAPVAVTKAAVLYVFRLLINKDIPLNSGCLDQIDIRIPRGCLLNPEDDAAVVGGNVETSQRVTDVLLGALGIAAASQGTMNNFVFGAEDGSGSQYYETIAGGSGAIDGSNGASAVQVHMTNTRSTDPEILEHRFREIMLDKFLIRDNSGGKGKYKGGDGVVRKVSFLQPRKVSIVSERRTIPPYGSAGGKSGSCGVNILKNKSGEIILDGKVELNVKAGEAIEIQTPGGGGFGRI